MKIAVYGIGILVIVGVLVSLKYWSFYECRKVGHGFVYCVVLK